MTALATRLRGRIAPRAESGLGLIELLIALTVLAVGIAATMAVFSSSIVSMVHAAREGTAITLADRQLESYRSMPWSCIPQSLPASTPSGCLSFSGFPNPYAASQTTTSSESPDHHIYTVTTAITQATTDSIQIAVTVTPAGGGDALAKETSYFSDAGTVGSG